MIVTKFRSVGWVAGVAVAALGCYLVSQRVSTERTELAKVERRILAAKRDIRQLEVEIQTRARLPQLERWNADVLALSAPRAAQFVENEVQLASWNTPKALPLDPAVVARVPEVRLASAEAPARAPARIAEPEASDAGQPLLRQATYVRPAGDRPQVTQASLLDDTLLVDIERIAATEQGSGKPKGAR